MKKLKTKKAERIRKVRAERLKALAHPTRLLFFEALEHGEMCVGDFQSLVGSDFSTVSRHLARLKQVGLVRWEKRGNLVFYSLSAPCLEPFLRCLDNLDVQED
jgi:ArsR family transcriptional regulator